MASAHAASAPGWLTSKPALQERAIENAIANLLRNDYVPTTAPDVGGSYYPERTGQALADAIRRVPTTAVRNELLQTATTQAATKTGLWPRLMETALGIARSRGAVIAGRAVPVLGAGMFVLWVVGNRKVEVRVTGHAVSATAVRMVSTGQNGVCAGYSAAGEDAGATNACAPSQHNFEWGSMNGSPPYLPARSLQVQMWDAQANVWRGGTRCVSRTDGSLSGTDYTGPLSTGGGTACNPLVPDNRDDYGYSYGMNSDSVINGWDEYPASSCGGFTPCRKYRFSEGFGAWFTDPDTAGAALRAPSDLLPPGWSDGDPATLTSTLPPPVPHSALQGPLATYLEGGSAQAQAMRDQMDHGLTEAGDPTDAKWQSSSTPPPAISDQGPSYGSFSMPSCAGLTDAACRAALSSAGHTGAISTSTLGLQTADLTLPPGAVVITNPLPATIVNPDVAVVLTENPDPLPSVVPAIGSGMTASQYVAALQQAGLVGNVVTLSDASLDPTKGPDAAVSASPAPGTRLSPGSTVTVQANPSTAPSVVVTPTEPPGGDAIDLSPLSKITPCERFPFGVPCWVVGALGGFGGGGNCPSFSVPMPFAQTLPIDLCVIQPAVDIFRPLLIVVSLFGLAWLFMGAAMGFGGKGGDD